MFLYTSINSPPAVMVLMAPPIELCEDEKKETLTLAKILYSNAVVLLKDLTTKYSSKDSST